MLQKKSWQKLFVCSNFATFQSLCCSQANQLSKCQTCSVEQMSNMTEFILLSLTQNPDVQKLFFVVFSTIYFLTLVGYLITVVKITKSPALGSPMYFFLFFLSLIDGCCSFTMAPKMPWGSSRAKETSGNNSQDREDKKK